MRHDSWRRSISYSPKYIIFAVSQLYYSSRSRARCCMYEKMDRFTTLTKNKITQYNYDIFFSGSINPQPGLFTWTLHGSPLLACEKRLPRKAAKMTKTPPSSSFKQGGANQDYWVKQRRMWSKGQKYAVPSLFHDVTFTEGFHQIVQAPSCHPRPEGKPNADLKSREA